METTDEEGDLDDPTRPFAHSQIGRMLNEAERAPPQREYPVDLSYFLGFGELGTPSGMIGSHDAKVAVGTCGDPPPRPQAPRVAPCPAGNEVAPVAELYPWGPAPAELSGEYPHVDPPSPWTLSGSNAPPVAETTAPEVVAVAAREPSPREAPGDRSDALDEDLRGAGLRSYAGLFVGGAALLACGLGGLIWWVTLPEPPPPPKTPPPEQITMVVTNYDEDDEADAGETEAEDGPGDGSAPVGRIEIDGPSKLTKIPPWRTQHCVTQRDRADVAFRAGNWEQLEEFSREATCWRPTRDAKVLRMNALFELGQLEECRKVGNDSNHKKIKKWMKLCSHDRG